MTAHKAERFEGGEGEIEREHREMKQGMGVNDGLEGEEGEKAREEK